MEKEIVVDINSLPLTNASSVSSVYCNNANVSIAPWDIRIIFSEIVGIRQNETANELRANIVMSPAHAKALAGALSSGVEQWENTFGPIKLPEQQSAPPAKAATPAKRVS